MSRSWKQSTIMPIAKKPGARELMTFDLSFLTLIKYADDMDLIGRLKDELSLSEYLLQIDALMCQ